MAPFSSHRNHAGRPESQREELRTIPHPSLSLLGHGQVTTVESRCSFGGISPRTETSDFIGGWGGGERQKKAIDLGAAGREREQNGSDRAELEVTPDASS